MSQKIRIIIESDSAVEEKISGIGYSTISILEGFNKLSEKDSRLRVVSIVPNKNSLPIELKKLKNIQYKKMPGVYRYSNYILAKLNFGFPADLIFGKGFYLFPNFKNWNLAFSRSTTFVHDMSYLKHPETVEPNNIKYLQSNLSRWLKRTTKIACISESTKRDLLYRYNELSDKTEVVHLGVDPSKYRKIPVLETKSITSKYGLPSSYILFVGNIEPRKNIDTLLAAYKNLYTKSAKIPPLAIVGGNGWSNESTLTHVKRLQNSGIPVYRNNRYVTNEDMPSIFSSAKILIHPAVYEGFGLPILQAMACGIPVICSKTSSMPEVGGEAAEYFDPHSHKELEDKIELVLHSKEQQLRMIKAGLDRSKKFTWSNVVRRILETGDIR
jgi:glycosyltransferase involved in cell wall biosynthesis